MIGLSGVGRWPAWAILVLCAACALQTNAVQLTVGRATGYDLLTRAEGVLNRQGYQAQERREEDSFIQVATSWTDRAPFADEAARGATACRTRFVIEARRQGSGLYTLILRAENTALTDDASGTW